MKNNILSLTGILIATVVVGVLVFLLYTSFASRASQIDNQTQQAEPSTPTAVADAAEPLTSTSTPTAAPDTADSLTPTPVFEIPTTSLFYLYSEEVDAIEGRILAQGTMPTPEPTPEGTPTPRITRERVESYRLEVLDLPEPITIKIDGTPTQTSVVWRLTVTGGPFRVAANSWVIWLDDVRLGDAIINLDMSEISVVFVDRSLLRHGSMIFISYGYFGNPIPVMELEFLKLGTAS